MVKSETLDLLDLAFVWQIRISYSYLSIFHHISSSFSCFRFELSPWSRVIFASICCVFKSGVGAKQLWRMIIHNKTRYTPSRSSVQPHNIFHFQVLFPLSSFATHIVALVMNSTKATIQQHPFEHMIVRQIPVASRKCKFCISVYFYYRLLPSFPSSSPTPVTCGQPKNPRDDPSTLFVSSSSCSPREETASMPTTTPLGSEMSLNDQCMLGATVLCQAFFCMQRTQSFVQGVRDSQNVHTSIRFLVFVRTCQSSLLHFEYILPKHIAIQVTQWGIVVSKKCSSFLSIHSQPQRLGETFLTANRVASSSAFQKGLSEFAISCLHKV